MSKENYTRESKREMPKWTVIQDHPGYLSKRPFGSKSRANE